MEIFRILPERLLIANSNEIPASCAVNKMEYIADRKEIIKKMDVEIESLKKRLNANVDTKDDSYRSLTKRLKKCYEIKQNCEDSIVLINKQLEIAKKSRIR